MGFLDFRIGIVAGIVLHIGMLIYNQNSPRILVERPTETDVRITLEHGIAFPVCEVNTHIIGLPRILLSKSKKLTHILGSTRHSQC